MTGNRLVVIFTVVIFLAPAVFAEETVRISGTGGAIGGMKLLGQAFERRNPGVKVDVLPSLGSTGGINAVKAGKLDLAVSARPLREDEKTSGLLEEPYAKAPFIFATSSKSRAEGLRLSEIQDIYAGKITTWPYGGRIHIVMRPASDAYTHFLEELSPGMKDALASAKNVPGLILGITDQDAAVQIEKIPNSFGVTSYTLVVSENRKIKPLSVDGISPVGKNGANEKYPYSMTFYLVYMKGRNTRPVSDFIDYTGSKEGERILRKAGHITIGKAKGKP